MFKRVLLPEEVEGKGFETIGSKIVGDTGRLINQFRCGVFGDCSHVMKINTPYKLINEMYDKLPELNGKQVLVWYTPEAYAVGISRYPNAKFTIVAGSKEATTFKIKGVEQIFCIDQTEESIDAICSLLMERDMKFDVVIGNPPYQAPKEGAAGHTQLWDKFVNKVLNLVKENGHIALIHPSPWRKPEHKLFKEFKKRVLKFLSIHNIEDGQKTFKCSTRYDWYILQNKSNEGELTVVEDENGIKNTIDINNFEFIPNSDLDLFEKILAKDEEETCRLFYDSASYHTQRPWMSKNKTHEAIYPCIYSMSKRDPITVVYSKINSNGHFGVPKIIINKKGATLCCLNDYEGIYGLTEWMFGIQTSSKEEGDNLISALKSDKFDKIWKATQWLSMNREWRVFKFLKKDFWKEFV